MQHLIEASMEGRYSRHTLLREIGEEGQERLRSAAVLLVGVGGLGSPIALYLVAAGVGRIGLVDSDTVSVSNLQRQVLYSEEEVGLPKVECAKRRLKRLNSEVEVECYNMRFEGEQAFEIASRYDLVVDGCDNFQTRYLIDEVTFRLGIPYVYGSIGEFHGQVSLFNCEGGIRYRDLYPDQSQLESRERVTQGVMGVVPGVVGGVEAAEVIKVITGCGTTLSGRLFTINLLTMESQTLELG